MGRIAGFLYGIAAYAFFLVTFLYAIGFVTGVAVPKTIDSGAVMPLVEAVVVNLILLTIFALQHSIMARKPFKQWLTRFIAEPLERPTYVLLATASLALLVWQWRPMPEVVWQVTNPAAASVLLGLSLSGFVIVLLSSFMINHFELFGLQQVLYNLTGKTIAPATFKTPGFYKLVRHPIYFGFMVGFWVTPVMTQGHLLFAAVTTAYILVGIWLEERDLVAVFGDQYRRYRQQVGMLVPFWRKA